MLQGSPLSDCPQTPNFFPENGDEIIEVRPARTFSELCAAFKLVYRHYLRLAYINPNSSGMHFNPQQLFPSSFTQIATIGGAVVGTGSLVINSEAGLPASSMFGEIFEGLRRQGRLVAEGTLFACESDDGASINPVSVQLIRQAIMFAIQSSVDDLCLVVNPKHLTFWTRIMGFERLDEREVCPHIKAEGILLRLDIRALSTDPRGARPFMKKLLAGGSEFAQECTRSILSANQVKLLLLSRIEVFDKLTPEQRLGLESLYPGILEFMSEALAVREAA